MSADLQSAVRSYFRELGNEVADSIYSELVKPGGLPRLLRRLGIPDPGDSKGQYQTLLGYFRRRGTKEFLELIGAKPIDFKVEFSADAAKQSAEMKAKNLEVQRAAAEREQQALGKRHPTTPVTPLPAADPPKAIKAQAPAALPLQAPAAVPPSAPAVVPASQSAMVSDKPVEGKIAVVKPPTPAKPEIIPAELIGPVPHVPKLVIVLKDVRHLDIRKFTERKSPYDIVDPDGFPIGPLLSSGLPTTTIDQDKWPSWDATKKWDPTGTWPEVERRSGRERRRLDDRRREVDIVYKNQRYGKPRRRPAERRKNWPSGGHAK